MKEKTNHAENTISKMSKRSQQNVHKNVVKYVLLFSLKILTFHLQEKDKGQ
jgi:hypothetical protein